MAKSTKQKEVTLGALFKQWRREKLTAVNLFYTVYKWTWIVVSLSALAGAIVLYFFVEENLFFRIVAGALAVNWLFVTWSKIVNK